MPTLREIAEVSVLKRKPTLVSQCAAVDVLINTSRLLTLFISSFKIKTGCQNKCQCELKILKSRPYIGLAFDILP